MRAIVLGSLGLFAVAGLFAFSSRHNNPQIELTGFQIVGSPGPYNQRVERPDMPTALAFNKTSTEIISRQENGEIYRWNIATGDKTKIAETAGAFAYCANASMVAVSTNDETLVLNADNGARIASMPGVNQHAAWSADCSQLIVANEDIAKFHSWDVQLETLIYSAATSLPVRNGLAVSHDGRLIAAATGSYEHHSGHIGKIETFKHAGDDAISGREIGDAQSIDGMWTMRFSSTSGHLLFGSQKKALSRLVSANVENGSVDWAGPYSKSYWIRAIAASPDGSIAASGDEKGELIVRDAANGAPLTSRHMGQVIQTLAFSENGGQLAIGLKNSTIAIMDSSEFLRMPPD